ncbi:MAG: restriction endonuclease subunit S [Pseudomonadota bacterium]
MVNLIAENIDIWSVAQAHKTNGGRGRGNNSNGQSPHGIKKLRELILELAVRGKLVSQDPNDEPASLLLEKIAKEKARLVKEGKIKKQNPFPKISEDEMLFKLPIGWEWFRAGDVFDFKYGKALPAKSRDDSGEVDVYGSNGVVGKYTEAFIDEPSIIIGRKGSAGALNKALRPSWTTDVAYFVVPPIGFDFDYTFLILQALRLDLLGKGIKPGLNRNEAYVLVAALPPLAEQHRIVAKVDELMALCDKLEQQQTDSNTVHQTLAETLLTTLTSAAGQDEFAEAWQRIANNFDTIFTTGHSIDKLKQTILQLAVMGKLVPQDPNDEPASILLEKIAKEKPRLIKEGKIKKQNPLPEISEDEKPFELPNGWEWVRLQQIIQISSGDGLIAANMNNEGGIPVFGGNGITGYHDQANVNKPTLVVGRVGFHCGSIHITPASAWVTDNAFKTTFSEKKIYINFLFWLLKGTNLKENENATAQPVISGRKVYPIVVGLPPTAEQHRIVAKVDKLMAICDALKARLIDAQTTQIQLADAIVEQAVA